MKLKKLLAVCMAATMAASLAGCGSKAEAPANDSAEATNDAAEESSDDAAAAEDTADGGLISYADLKLGEDCTDLTASLTVYNNRTDMSQDDYKGKKWLEYI